MDQCKVTKERLKKKYLQRKIGQREALAHLAETGYNIKRSLKRIKGRSQNPN